MILHLKCSSDHDNDRRTTFTSNLDGLQLSQPYVANAVSSKTITVRWCSRFNTMVHARHFLLLSLSHPHTFAYYFSLQSPTPHFRLFFLIIHYLALCAFANAQNYWDKRKTLKRVQLHICISLPDYILHHLIFLYIVFGNSYCISNVGFKMWKVQWSISILDLVFGVKLRILQFSNPTELLGGEKREGEREKIISKKLRRRKLRT